MRACCVYTAQGASGDGGFRPTRHPDLWTPRPGARRLSSAAAVSTAQRGQDQQVHLGTVGLWGRGQRRPGSGAVVSAVWAAGGGQDCRCTRHCLRAGAACKGVCVEALVLVYTVHAYIHVLMRDERKEEKNKQGQTNNKAKENELP